MPGFAVLSLLLALFFGIVVHSAVADRDGEEWMSDFRQILTRENIRSADQLLTFLPQELRSRHILMFASESLQRASFDHPRVILVSPMAKFIVAFNGSPEQDGFESVETIRFTTQHGRPEFIFEEFVFPDDLQARMDYLRKQKLQGELQALENRRSRQGSNPARCFACHRHDLRPNWSHYPLWLGAYGQLDDNITIANGPHEYDPTSGLRIAVDNSEAAKQLPLFVSAAPSLPRYRNLLNLENHLASRSGINARFTSDLEQLNFQRVHYLLQQFPDYGQIRARLMMVGWGCDLSALHFQDGPPVPYYLSSQTAKRFHYVLQDKPGVPVDDLFLNFTVGPGNSMTTPGLDSKELAYYLVHDDNDMSKFFNYEFQDTSDYLVWWASPTVMDDLCQMLFQQSGR